MRWGRQAALGAPVLSNREAISTAPMVAFLGQRGHHDRKTKGRLAAAFS
jgi:hypothetical protein